MAIVPAATMPLVPAEVGIVDHWLTTIVNPHTRAAYRNDVRSWAAYLASVAGDRPWSIIDATPTAAANWTRTMAEAGLATATISRRQATLSRFYRWAARQDIGAITDGRPNPFSSDYIQRIKPTSVHTDALTHDQVMALLAAARSGPHPRRDWLVVRLLSTTGARVSEICAATRADIVPSPAGHRLVLRHGKGNKIRMVPLAPGIVSALGDAELSSPLVEANTGGHLDRQQVRRILDRLARHADIPRLTPHMMRATAVTELLDIGHELGAVQDLAGHADPRTTRGYQARRHAATTQAAMAAALYARFTPPEEDAAP